MSAVPAEWGKEQMAKDLDRLTDLCETQARDFKACRDLADALAAALERVEWAQKATRLKNGGTIYTAITCPSCGGEKDPPDDRRQPREAGHRPGCELAAALESYRKARGA